jgi:serine/threonine protein kinase
VKGAPLENSRAINGQILPYAVISVIVVLLVGISVFLLYRRAKKKSSSPYSLTTTSMTVSQTFTDLETVVNSVLAISKHAAYLWESSAVAKIKKLATGGGGELFLAKLMDSNLRRRYGDQVVQKITFVKSKLTEDAFYQEVGIMIMLNSFPRFCKILGYTENPLSMILKYYSDGSLHEWLMKNRYSSAILLKITKEVSEALQTMHSYYLAHCDLKPQNVLVQVENGIPSCFLTDFGIAQILSDTIIAAKAFNIISLRGL